MGFSAEKKNHALSAALPFFPAQTKKLAVGVARINTGLVFNIKLIAPETRLKVKEA